MIFQAVKLKNSVHFKYSLQGTRARDKCLFWLPAPCEGEGLVDLITSSGTLSSTATGLVRVCVARNKGAVCDYDWGFPDAVVACRAAGYSPYGNFAKVHFA